MQFGDIIKWAAQNLANNLLLTLEAPAPGWKRRSLTIPQKSPRQKNWFTTMPIPNSSPNLSLKSVEWQYNKLNVFRTLAPYWDTTAVLVCLCCSTCVCLGNFDFYLCTSDRYVLSKIWWMGRDTCDRKRYAHENGSDEGCKRYCSVHSLHSFSVAPILCMSPPCPYVTSLPNSS